MTIPDTVIKHMLRWHSSHIASETARILLNCAYCTHLVLCVEDAEQLLWVGLGKGTDCFQNLLELDAI